jgi:hypothetical protein
MRMHRAAMLIAWWGLSCAAGVGAQTVTARWEFGSRDPATAWDKPIFPARDWEPWTALGRYAKPARAPEAAVSQVEAGPQAPRSLSGFTVTRVDARLSWTSPRLRLKLLPGDPKDTDGPGAWRKVVLPPTHVVLVVRNPLLDARISLVFQERDDTVHVVDVMGQSPPGSPDRHPWSYVFAELVARDAFWTLRPRGPARDIRLAGIEVENLELSRSMDSYYWSRYAGLTAEERTSLARAWQEDPPVNAVGPVRLDIAEIRMEE